MDYSERNIRCFSNRMTNVFQGISMQPVYGGPVYVFRNVMDNVAVETFKLHNSPSGCLMFHNTSVKKGMPLSPLDFRAGAPLPVTKQPVHRDGRRLCV